MFDLKSKLAAAGLVTEEQIKKFDEREAKAREKKQARHKKPGKQKSPRPRKVAGIDVDGIKKLPKGEAYARIRPIIEHNRLDDKERTIPSEDDQVFNFVTKTGRIGRLYLKEETVQSLAKGKSAICSYMSHHGLSHCVLPKDVALAIAEIFPIWLRHLQGNPNAGQIERPEPDEPTKDG